MSAKNTKVMILSFVAALLLDMLPLPGITIWFRPQWTLLVLIYWLIEVPYAIGFFVVFCLGIILDILNGTLLGMHAVGFLIISYIVYQSYHRIRSYPMPHQTVVIFFMILFYQIIFLIILMIVNAAPRTALYFGSALTTAILWPWAFRLMHELVAVVKD